MAHREGLNSIDSCKPFLRFHRNLGFLCSPLRDLVERTLPRLLVRLFCVLFSPRADGGSLRRDVHLQNLAKFKGICLWPILPFGGARPEPRSSFAHVSLVLTLQLLVRRLWVPRQEPHRRRHRCDKGLVRLASCTPSRCSMPALYSCEACWNVCAPSLIKNGVCDLIFLSCYRCLVSAPPDSSRLLRLAPGSAPTSSVPVVIPFDVSSSSTERRTEAAFYE